MLNSAAKSSIVKSILTLRRQEERRLRTAYEDAEGSEREKFALFSAGVRESHEKERTRAERTKNWSIIGSVLGALIGVMGSTYINRVRLQVRRRRRHNQVTSRCPTALKFHVFCSHVCRITAGL